MTTKKFVVRCRAIIFHEGKLLVVKHPHNPSFVALPGGHLEWGENVKECITREIAEELGIEPKIGRLLYINTFQDGRDVQPIEFFFEVTNAADFVDCHALERSHAHELEEIFWLSPQDDAVLLPQQLHSDFRSNTLLSDTVRCVTGSFDN